MPEELAAAFSPDATSRRAGLPAYQRGVSYAKAGRVDELVQDLDRASATVRGTMPYHVELRVAGGKPRWSCTCPAAEDGALCKHCVAVACVVTGDTGRRSGRTDTGAAPTGSTDVAEYVRGLAPERLADLVLEQADHDQRLHERLTAEAAAARGESIDVREWRKRLRAAIVPRRFVEYRRMPDWWHGVDEALDAIGALADAGHAAVVIPLLEDAHRFTEKAMERVDDSSGEITMTFTRVADLHLRACQSARPDPVELGRRLAELELEGELDTFHRAAATYAHVLDDEGLAEYRRIVAPRFEAIDPASDRYSAFRVVNAMVGVAIASGDPDELIAVRRGALQIPDDYEEIVKMLHAAGRTDEAIEWARRGIASFAGRERQLRELRELLADLLREHGDADGALEVYWDGFLAQPSLGSYRALLEQAGDERASARVAALGHLRARVEQAGDGALASALASVLAEVLVYEGEVDAAWQVASAHGAGRDLTLRLARAREAAHPLDAIYVYAGEVEAQVDTKQNRGYRAAADLIARIERLYHGLGREIDFDAYVGSVRAEHKAKRNLMALFEKHGW